MNENKGLQARQTFDNQNTAEKFLDTVVDSIIKKQKKVKENVIANQKYPDIYSNIKQVFNEFDETIFECKKYNEAKIHRKYQIRIKDLEEEIKILNDKINQEQRARSPSKKYVQQLINQLVIYKDKNEKLQQKIKEISIKYQQEYRALPNKQLENSKIFSHDIKSRQDSLLPDIQNPQTANILADSVNQFLRIKHTQRKVRSGAKKTRFQSFLKSMKHNYASMSMIQFLESVDEWSNQLQSRLQVIKSSRLKSNILSTLEDEIGEKNNKIKFPKVYNIDKPIKIPIMREQQLGANSVLRRGRQKQKNNRKYHSTIQVIPKYKLM